MPDLFDYPGARFGSPARPTWSNIYQRDQWGRISQVRGVGRTKPGWTITPSWAGAGQDLAALVTALRSLRAGAVECYFYTPSQFEWWDDASAGTGNGVNLLFPFGGTDLQALLAAPVVKIDGVTQTQWYTVEVIPADSLKRWRIAFTAGHAPADTKPVTISFLGRRLLLGRIQEDTGPMNPTSRNFEELSAVLQGEEV